eukprot:1176767-Prorocentrum_minimum.AAC.3
MRSGRSSQNASRPRRPYTPLQGWRLCDEIGDTRLRAHFGDGTPWVTSRYLVVTVIYSFIRFDVSKGCRGLVRSSVGVWPSDVGRMSQAYHLCSLRSPSFHLSARGLDAHIREKRTLLKSNQTGRPLVKAIS